MATKPKKNNRKEFLLTDQDISYLEELATRMGKSLAEIVRLSIFCFYQDKEKFLFCPPELGQNMWLKEQVPVTDGIIEFECDNGSMWVNVENWEIVKSKQVAVY